MQHERVFIIKDLRRYIVTVLIMAAAFCCLSCGSKTAAVPSQPEAGTEPEEKVDLKELEAEDRAVFLTYDVRHNDVKLMSVDNGRTYSVSINELTTFEDNYGKVSVPELFEPGMIVDVSVSVHSRSLNSLKQAPDAFLKRDVENFDINMNRGIFRLEDGTNLHVTENTLVLKDDRVVEASDISRNDVLEIRGVEPELYSVRIMSGYGHLRIKGSQYFTGGWVQIAGMFKPVMDDMLLDVPEGEYDMTVTYKGQGGVKHVVITRGKETSVDVSDLKGDLIKTGEIVFSIRPPEAVPVVKIDGKVADHLEPVTLEYGVYQLEISAEGYAPIKERISVGTEVSNIDIELTKEDGSSSDTVSENKTKKKDTENTISANNLPTTFTDNGNDGKTDTSSGSTSSSSSSGTTTSSSGSSTAGTPYESSIIQGSRIYIDEPQTAEVYFDGIYKGIVPCSFVKESGTHVITLRKDGYETRTFTVTLDNSKENETYSFSALQEK